MTLTKKEQKDILNTLGEAVNNIGYALTKADNQAQCYSLGAALTRLSDFMIRVNDAETKELNCCSCFYENIITYVWNIEDEDIIINNFVI